MNKTKLKLILKMLLIFIIQFAFSRLEIFGMFPLGFAFAMVRVFFGENLMVVCAEYFISNLFGIFDFYFLLNLAFEIIVLSLYYFFKETVKTKRKRLFMILFLCLSTMFKAYLLVCGKIKWQNYLIETFIKIIACLYFMKTHLVFQKKFIFLKCGNLDYLLFSIFIILFVLGIFEYRFLADVLGLCLFSFAIIFACRILPSDKFLVFSLIVSLCFGYIFSSTKLVIMSVIFVVVIISFSKTYKYLYLSIVLFAMFAMLKIFGELCARNIVSLFAGLLVVAILPQKWTNVLVEFFEDKNLNLIKENLWQEREKEVKQNLELMSKTLSKMQSDFKYLIVGKIDRKYASGELAKDIMNRCCENCEHKILCNNSLIDKKSLLTEYVFYAITNNGVLMENFSVGFRTYCNKTNLILSEINSVSKKFLEFEASVKSEDESKLLISTELGNFANLFKNFSKNIEKSPKINKNLSKLAKEMLVNNMVDVGDVGVFENENGIEKIDIIADNNLMTRKELAGCLSKIMRNSVQVKKIKHLDFSGLSLVSFVVANDLRAEFAVSASSKEDVSGDNTLISKVDENRYFVAIADGMGHGKIAGKTSKMVLELIKNLFFIGIDLEVIIDSINKLLLPVGLENFSTLDIAVVDLRLSKCTFIKLGSSVSAIKHKNTTDIISCESLPVGIVQNLKPTIVTRSIKDGDVIVMASDGVVDSYGEIENFKIYVNDYKIDNLQRFVDNVIFELGMQSNKHKDDMSIIALKLLKNSKK